MKRHLAAVLLCIITISFAHNARCQTPKGAGNRGSAHIAIVDINKVIRNYKPYTEYEKGIQTLLEGVKKQIEEREATLAAMKKQQTDLASEVKNLPERSEEWVKKQDDLKNVAAEIADKADQLFRFRENASATYVADLKREAVRVANKLIRFVGTYAPSKGYSVVINVPSVDGKNAQNAISSDVIVGLDQLRGEAKDLTDEVIQAFK